MLGFCKQAFDKNPTRRQKVNSGDTAPRDHQLATESKPRGLRGHSNPVTVGAAGSNLGVGVTSGRHRRRLLPPAAGAQSINLSLGRFYEICRRFSNFAPPPTNQIVCASSSRPAEFPLLFLSRRSFLFRIVRFDLSWYVFTKIPHAILIRYY